MDKKTYLKLKAKIYAKARQRKHRILFPSNTEDGFASPLAMSVKEAIKDLNRERAKELLELEKQFRKSFFDMDAGRESEFIRMEKEIASVGGDSDLYYRKHGYDGNPHKKSEYYKLDAKGNIQNDSNICSRCGKTKQNCRCDQRKNDWLIVK